jgi:hypothetical protein
MIAERGARSGVVVGSWQELIAWARHAYLVPPCSEKWQEALHAALDGLKDAFWSDSCSIAPVETAAAVSSALEQILSATDPAVEIAAPGLSDLPQRPGRHLGDLVRLAQSLGGRLPPELEAIKAVLAADRCNALHTLRVECVRGAPLLTRWQSELIEKLNRDAGDAVAGEPFRNLLEGVFSPERRRDSRDALGSLQSQLYRPTEHRTELDESVQWLGVRDFLQEAEVAAGMVQRLLAEHPDLKASQIGLLVPDSFEYSVAVEDAFRLAGIALSGLPAERWRRDLGREAVYHFLYCRQKPAPAMALAVCLSSPLMPWSQETGAVLAQTVMDGTYELRAPADASAETHAMLDLLRAGDSEPASLLQAFVAFGALLEGGEALAGHAQQARVAIDLLRAMLAGAAAIDWLALRRAVIPKLVTSGETPDFNLEGVTVWRESQEPWRAVRRLIVLGFSQRRYPAALEVNPVFSVSDIEAIRKCTGLPVRTPGEELAQRRARWLRQLGAASESASFLVPRRDPAGEPQAPSESLVFMHRLLKAPESADALIVELDSAEERAHARYVALAAPERPCPPRTLVVEDLCFDRDLLTLRTATNGMPKPESPSSLETLMVSRLAWLMRGLEAEPLEWTTESPDPALLGTLAHAVFEGLFHPGVPLPARKEIPQRVERLLDDALQRRAPFMRSSQWSVERRHFATQTTIAAVAWLDALAQLGAEVLGSEQWLQGPWSGIAVHGQTDLIIGLPGERLLVVDYKRSKSAKRQAQMQKGYDSQATLYRAMLQSGGLKSSDNATLIARIRAAAQTGIVYYMLNDQVVLSDSELPGTSAVPGWKTLKDDISGQAMALIGQRLAEVRAGKLYLNRSGDAEFFGKTAGITPYALEKSPLIGLFMMPASPEEEP